MKVYNTELQRLQEEMMEEKRLEAFFFFFYRLAGAHQDQ